MHAALLYRLFFTNALWIIFKGNFNADGESVFGGALYDWMDVLVLGLRWMYGDTDYGTFQQFPETEALIAIVLFFTYTAVTAIMLLNMLIAMMGNTYNATVEDAEHRWLLAYASTICTIRSATSQHPVRQYLREMLDDNRTSIPSKHQALAKADKDDELQELRDLVLQVLNRLGDGGDVDATLDAEMNMMPSTPANAATAAATMLGRQARGALTPRAQYDGTGFNQQRPTLEKRLMRAALLRNTPQARPRGPQSNRASLNASRNPSQHPSRPSSAIYERAAGATVHTTKAQQSSLS